MSRRVGSGSVGRRRRGIRGDVDPDLEREDVPSRLIAPGPGVPSARSGRSGASNPRGGSGGDRGHSRGRRVDASATSTQRRRQRGFSKPTPKRSGGRQRAGTFHSRDRESAFTASTATSRMRQRTSTSRLPRNIADEPRNVLPAWVRLRQEKRSGRRGRQRSSSLTKPFGRKGGLKASSSLKDLNGPGPKKGSLLRRFQTISEERERNEKQRRREREEFLSSTEGDVDVDVDFEGGRASGRQGPEESLLPDIHGDVHEKVEVAVPSPSPSAAAAHAPPSKREERRMMERIRARLRLRPEDEGSPLNRRERRQSAPAAAGTGTGTPSSHSRHLKRRRDRERDREQESSQPRERRDSGSSRGRKLLLGPPTTARPPSGRQMLMEVDARRAAKIARMRRMGMRAAGDGMTNHDLKEKRGRDRQRSPDRDSDLKWRDRGRDRDRDRDRERERQPEPTPPSPSPLSPTPTPTPVASASVSPKEEEGEGNEPFAAKSPPPDAPIRRIANRWDLLSILGAGSFGLIYKVIDVATGELFAVKLEPRNSKYPQVIREARLMKYLGMSTRAVGIPRMFYYGFEQNYNVAVMDYLGPSLEDVFNRCGRRFSLKTTLMLADQMVKRLEYCHSKNFIHRDLKPVCFVVFDSFFQKDNFLLGRGRRAHIVYIIDFGLAKKYRDSRGVHVRWRDDKRLTGTARYASVNNHLGVEQSRRDELESLCYVLLYFLVGGKLPWMGLYARTRKEKYGRILEKKTSISPERLCEGIPGEFARMLTYARGLAFEDKPDYDYVRNMFKALFVRKGFELDYKFDWVGLPETSPRRRIRKNHKYKW